MPESDSHLHPFAHYLLSKRSVDDRALHPRLWRAILIYLDDLCPTRSRAEPLHILELGCGIGTMFERLANALPTLTSAPALLYTGLDSEAPNLDVADARLGELAIARGYTHQTSTSPAATTAQTHARRTYINPHGHTLTIQLLAADAYTVAELLASPAPPVHALIAHAFLDLMECRPLLRSLHPILHPAARLYCTINFDGMTVFEPPIDPELDRTIEQLYHASMDTRTVGGRPAGHSQTGRRLFHDFRATGYTVLDLGSSDWTVYPQPHGYANEDAAFLHHILDFVAGALAGHEALAPHALESWIATRRKQIETGELFYMAHQLDYLARPD